MIFVHMVKKGKREFGRTDFRRRHLAASIILKRS
jgi:hypothetical protein